MGGAVVAGGVDVVGGGDVGDVVVGGAVGDAVVVDVLGTAGEDALGVDDAVVVEGEASAVVAATSGVPLPPSGRVHVVVPPVEAPLPGR